MTHELQSLGDAIFEATQKAFLKLFENGEHLLLLCVTHYGGGASSLYCGVVGGSLRAIGKGRIYPRRGNIIL